VGFIDIDGEEDKYYALTLNFSTNSKLHNVTFEALPELNAGEHEWGDKKWTVPVGPKGKGDAVYIRVSYNETPTTVTTKTILGYFYPRPKTFLEKLGDILKPHKDEDIGEGYYMTGEEGGSGDPFGPGAKKVEHIEKADLLISLAGTANGTFSNIPNSEGVEKIADVLETINRAMEAGEDFGKAVNIAKGEESEGDPKTVYCRNCEQNYFLDSNGHVTRNVSQNKASDTVNYHEDPERKVDDKNKNGSKN
jgi:hypothetical protein